MPPSHESPHTAAAKEQPSATASAGQAIRSLKGEDSFQGSCLTSPHPLGILAPPAAIRHGSDSRRRTVVSAGTTLGLLRLPGRRGKHLDGKIVCFTLFHLLPHASLFFFFYFKKYYPGGSAFWESHAHEDPNYLSYLSCFAYKMSKRMGRERLPPFQRQRQATDQRVLAARDTFPGRKMLLPGVGSLLPGNWGPGLIPCQGWLLLSQHPD